MGLSAYMVKVKVDKGGALKEMMEEFSEIKSDLKEHGREKRTKKLLGHDFMAKISAYGYSDADLVAVFNELCSGNFSKFLKFVKPNVGAIREYCGDHGIPESDYITSESDKFGAITFKRIDDKKAPKRVKLNNGVIRRRKNVK
jgi:hypothetical protein